MGGSDRIGRLTQPPHSIDVLMYYILIIKEKMTPFPVTIGPLLFKYKGYFSNVFQKM